MNPEIPAGERCYDACIVALMQAHEIKRLVTNDQDFLDVPGIIIHKPRKLIGA